MKKKKPGTKRVLARFSCPCHGGGRMFRLYRHRQKVRAQICFWILTLKGCRQERKLLQIRLLQQADILLQRAMTAVQHFIWTALLLSGLMSQRVMEQAF